ASFSFQFEGRIMNWNRCQKRTTTREKMFNYLKRLCFGGEFDDHVYCFPQIYYYFERNPSHLEPLDNSEKDVLKGFLHEEACLFLTFGTVGDNPRELLLGMKHYRLSVLPAVHKLITTEREREFYDLLIRRLTKTETQLMRGPYTRQSEEKVTSILGTWEELNKQLDRNDYWDLLQEYRLTD
ncbi:hypothetical protein PFISCL1PPCAC_23565, partial [Pristionchus fissidentatus]